MPVGSGNCTPTRSLFSSHRTTVPILQAQCSGTSTIHTSLYKKINRSHTHTHTPTENNTPDTDTHAHDKNTTPNPQMNTSHEHLTTLEDGAIYIYEYAHLYMDRDARRVRKLHPHTQFILVLPDHRPHPKSNMQRWVKYISLYLHISGYVHLYIEIEISEGGPAGQAEARNEVQRATLR